jgi:hypothetical protein
MIGGSIPWLGAKEWMEVDGHVMGLVCEKTLMQINDDSNLDSEKPCFTLGKVREIRWLVGIGQPTGQWVQGESLRGM